MKTVFAREILIKGNYDGNGGVESVTVSKYESYNEQGTLFDKEIIFKGDIPKISEKDIDEEIKKSLKDNFSIEGYETILSLL